MADVPLRLLIEAINKAAAPLEQARKQIDNLGKAGQRAGTETGKGAGAAAKGFRDTGTAAEQAAQKVESLNRAALGLAQAGLALTAAGAALSAAVIFPVKQAAEFEQAMAGVRAVTSGAEENFEDLRGKAEELGRTTFFTATQAAEGMTFLGRAGFEAGEVIAGIRPALLLARAGSLDLAEAADIATNVLSAMRLEVTELNHVADVLAATAKSSNTNVQQLSQALKFVAPAAAASGIQVEEIAAAIGVLGDNGIHATMAGTGLRAMLVALSSPTNQANETLERLGVSIAKNADGGVDLTETMRRLRDAQFGLADAAAIFNRRAATSALAMANNVDKMEELTAANITSAGEAEKMARILGETLQGALIRLSSAFEGLIIAVGDPLLAPLTALVGVLTEMVQWVAELVSEYPTLTAIIAGSVGVIGALTAALGAMLLVMAGVTKAWAGINTILLLSRARLLQVIKVLGLLRAASLAFIATPLGITITAIGVAIGAVVLAYRAFNKDQQKVADTAAESVRELDEELRILRELQEVFDDTEEDADAFLQAEIKLAKVMPGVNLSIDDQGRILAKQGDGFEENARKLAEYIKQLERQRDLKFAIQLEAQVRALQDVEEELEDQIQNISKWYGIAVDGNEKQEAAAGGLLLAINKLTGTYDKEIEKLDELRGRQQKAEDGFEIMAQAALKAGLSSEDFVAQLDKVNASAEIKERALESYKELQDAMTDTGDTTLDLKKKIEEQEDAIKESEKAFDDFGKKAEDAYKKAIDKAEEFRKKAKDVESSIRDLTLDVEEDIFDIRQRNRTEREKDAALAQRIEFLKTEATKAAEQERFDVAERFGDRLLELQKRRIGLVEELTAEGIKPDLEPAIAEYDRLKQFVITNVKEPQIEAAEAAAESWVAKAEEIKQTYLDIKQQFEEGIDLTINTKPFDDALANLQTIVGEEIKLEAKVDFTGIGSTELPITEKIDEIEKEVGDMVEFIESEDATFTLDTSDAFFRLNKLKDLLDSITDKTITITVRRVEESAAGGIIGPIGVAGVRGSRGFKLGGYGGGDRISALLEAGERVTNKISTAVMDKYYPGFMNTINSIRSRFDARALMDSVRMGFRSGGLVLPPVYKFQAGGVVGQARGFEDLGKITISAGGRDFPVLAEPNVAVALKEELRREKLVRSN